jgi:hypothetical protein
MAITGKSETNGYFEIHCECGAYTTNVYLGWGTATGNMMPTIEARCEKCGKNEKYQLNSSRWRGLPSEPIVD